MRRPPLAMLATVLAVPAPALACSSCAYNTGNDLMVYLGTAAFMGVLPLVMVAALALWLRRRQRSRGVESADRDPVPGAPAGSVSAPRS